jgi:hypothetical protein
MLTCPFKLITLHKKSTAPHTKYKLCFCTLGSSHGSVGQGSPGGAQLEPEDSETEAVWSDGDLNMMGGGS